MRIFLDTSGLIALSDEKDRNHDKARAYLTEQVEKGARFILGCKLLVIESVTGADRDKAIRYFRKYRDQQIDLTDCLSFAMMERLALNTAFTFDNDFKTHGFAVID